MQRRVWVILVNGFLIEKIRERITPTAGFVNLLLEEAEQLDITQEIIPPPGSAIGDFLRVNSIDLSIIRAGKAHIFTVARYHSISQQIRFALKHKSAVNPGLIWGWQVSPVIPDRQRETFIDEQLREVRIADKLVAFKEIGHPVWRNEGCIDRHVGGCANRYKIVAHFAPIGVDLLPGCGIITTDILLAFE